MCGSSVHVQMSCTPTTVGLRAPAVVLNTDHRKRHHDAMVLHEISTTTYTLFSSQFNTFNVMFPSM